MPYTTERGVRLYYDHDTPLKFASAADEDRHLYNEQRDRAADAAEMLAGLLDRAFDEQACDGTKMRHIANELCGLLAVARSYLREGL